MRLRTFLVGLTALSLCIVASNILLGKHTGLPLFGKRRVSRMAAPVNCGQSIYHITHALRLTYAIDLGKACALPPNEVSCKEYLTIPEQGLDRLLSWIVPRGSNVYMCTDHIRKPPEKCVVYWFGIGQDWSGPEQMVADLGCTVYAYDPDPQPHPVPHGVVHEQIGIGSVSGKHKGASTTYTGATEYQIMSLKDLLKRNGHYTAEERMTVDVLRIDAEGAEYDLFSSLDGSTLRHFGQLSMEVHTATSSDSREPHTDVALHGSSPNPCDMAWFKKKAAGAGAKLRTFYSAHNCHGAGHFVEVGFLINQQMYW